MLVWYVLHVAHSKIGGPMAKGQQRSNREIKKPKKEKAVLSLATPTSGKSSSPTLGLFKKKV
jgi:hypothetical protein